MLKRIILVFLMVLFAWSCSEDEAVVRVDMDKTVSVKAPVLEDAVTYSYLPQYSHTTSYRRHNPLIEYLAKATGLKLRQVFPATFEEHLLMVARGEIDISFSNPLVYIGLARTGAKAFARIIEPSGNPTFRGQIIKRKDNQRIQSLADCRGKTWIAVDPLSAGGYLFALGLFLDYGITRHDFADIAFSPGSGGKQEKAVLAVYAGKFDIASIRQGTLDVVRKKINPEAIEILATTRAYPSWVYAARKGLDPKIVKSLAGAMFKLSPDDPDQKEILDRAGIKGIIPARDSDYDPVRELLARLGMGNVFSVREKS